MDHGDLNSFVFPEEANVPVEMITDNKPEEIEEVDPQATGGETAFALH